MLFTNKAIRFDNNSRTQSGLRYFNLFKIVRKCGNSSGRIVDIYAVIYIYISTINIYKKEKNPD